MSSLPTRKLGAHGPKVPALGFGLMGLSGFYGPPKPDSSRLALLSHAYESGVRHWDTSDIYGDSEALLGQYLSLHPTHRADLFLATKFAATTDAATGQPTISNTPSYMRAALSASLARLGTPYIDLFYVHRVDASQAIEVTMRALRELKAEGKIRHIGLSEVSGETVRRACKVVHVDAVQVEYSPFTLDVEREEVGLLSACRELGVAVVAYAPLGRGFLTGSLKGPEDFEAGDFRAYAPRFSKENFHKNLELVDSLKRIADAKGCTTGQLTLAWLMSQGDDIFPIPGTTRISNFDENLGSLKVKISDDEEREIRALVEKADVKGHRYPEMWATDLFVDTVPEEA